MPAGFEDSDVRSVFLVGARVALIREYIAAMRSEKPRKWGVLLSGPNGVGKSGVGLLTFLACFAQRLMAVYLPQGSAWVQAARDDRGDAFFLEQLVKQNADLIAANSLLLPVFLPFFRDTEELGSAAMRRFTKVLELNHRLAVGIVLDEAQAITKAVEQPAVGGKLDDKSVSASNYFRFQWYNWEVRPAIYFVRMDVASSHGE